MIKPPSKYSSRNTTKNQNTGNHYEIEQEKRNKALEALAKAKELEKISSKPVKYLTK